MMPLVFFNEMQRHGVYRALIYHVQGESISGLDGNEALSNLGRRELTQVQPTVDGWP